ncbi:site-specific DNA-methyltransferase [uncultured Ruminococcus sp.]|uniref:DNA-methyltransferase n=1 Tax=uncultured Ruminococcus sp. TaxID=165186 RepID=UPI002600A150|nr:site-specific DNA-methyltransferase [uncultured Ruminococcus sp.]
MIDLQQGDCLELMKNIPDKSVDMILCDLPYGKTACRWDTIIPFKSLWENYNRIIKDNGAICLFGTEPFSTELRHSNLKIFKYDLIWDKLSTFGFLDCKFRPLKNFEIISVFSKGGCSNGSKIPMKYNPQGVVYHNKKSRKKTNNEVFHSPIEKEHYSTGENFPRSIVKYKIEKGFHPSQKPVPLLEYLIKTYTLEGDTVLDNCMGSGSTGVACVNTNRNFIGMELDEHYFEVAQNRIYDTVKNKEQAG